MPDWCSTWQNSAMTLRFGVAPNLVNLWKATTCQQKNLQLLDDPPVDDGLSQLAHQLPVPWLFAAEDQETCRFDWFGPKPFRGRESAALSKTQDGHRANVAALGQFPLWFHVAPLDLERLQPSMEQQGWSLLPFLFLLLSLRSVEKAILHNWDASYILGSDTTG